ncbi:MAG: sulfurtransferase FdhD [Rhodobacterales bacterium]|nr:MAG: sulfurtransferase FdhD [Rhodobacterales bacterium]
MTATFRNNDRLHRHAVVASVSQRLIGKAAQIGLLAQETPVAIVFNGTTAAVMMASPMDLRDFAYGFALSEGFVHDLTEIEEFEQITHDNGNEARFWLTDSAKDRIETRRRIMTGVVGCGLCGVDSLEQAIRPVPALTSPAPAFDTDEILSAPDLLRAYQALHDATRAVHAAAFMLPGQEVIVAREDIGRHNALDKLAGALVHQGIDPAQGAIVITSRVSVDLVQKSVTIGCPMLVSVSAPTARAVDLAKNVGMTLIANVKRGGGVCYS